MLKKVKTILVPIDFSPVTGAVVKQARTVARLIGAQLVLVHVVKLPILGDYPGMVVESADIVDSATRSAQAQLKRICQRLRPQGIRATSHIFIGSPPSEILDAANKTRAQYIVIGSHGHRALYTVLVGSTTATVLKHAHCPVVVVPSPEVRARSGRRARRL